MNFLNAEILPLDEQAMERAWKRSDSLSKPYGSLGELERTAIRIAGITGRIQNSLKKRVVIVMAADNGIYEEGISPVPQEATSLRVRAMLKNTTWIGVMTAMRGIELDIVDIGMKGEKIPGVTDEKLMDGTFNITRGYAMKREICETAIEAGFLIAAGHAERGMEIIGTGEIGICNTATSAAVLSALTGEAPEQTVCEGVGLTNEFYRKELEAVRRALMLNAPFADAVDAIAKVGGLDIAGMAGIFIGCAHMRIPVVIDGFASIVAALAASKIRPEIKPFLFSSHRSAEKGFQIAAKMLDTHPPLDLDMCLGEGTGTPLMMDILRTACQLQTDMNTLEELGLA